MWDKYEIKGNRMRCDFASKIPGVLHGTTSDHFASRKKQILMYDMS